MPYQGHINYHLHRIVPPTQFKGSPIRIYFFKEEQNRGRPNWEHLNEELHVLITVEDSENRAEIKLQRAIAEIEKLLIPAVRILILS